MQLPPMPGVPEPLAGKFTIAVRYVYTGNPDDGARWLAPLRAAGTPLLDAVGPMPSSMIGLVHADPDDALPAAEGSALLTSFDTAAADALLAVAGPDSASPQLMVESMSVWAYGGTLSNFSAYTGKSGFSANYTVPVLEKLTLLAQEFDPEHLFRLGRVPTR